MLGVHAMIENVLDKMLAIRRGPGIGCGGEGEDENAEERDRIHHGITFILDERERGSSLSVGFCPRIILCRGALNQN